MDNGASYVSVGGRMEMGVKENEKYFQLYVQDLLSAFARESISPISRDILSPSLFMVFKNLPAFSQSDSIASGYI